MHQKYQQNQKTPSIIIFLEQDYLLSVDTAFDS